MTHYTTLKLTQTGSVLTIALNRPNKANSVDMTLATELREAASQASHDTNIRCVILTGEGKFFCAGGDLSTFGDKTADTGIVLHALSTTFHEAQNILLQMPKPLLVLVNGPAAGAGMGLALSGDIVLCAPSAHFTPNFSAVGLTPDGGLTWLLPRLVGWRKAQEIIFRNLRVGGAEAQDIGLVTRCIDDTNLMAEATKTAQKMSISAIEALSRTRQLLFEGQRQPLDKQLINEATSISNAGTKAEAKEGISAFFEKRKPDFESTRKND